MTGPCDKPLCLDDVRSFNFPVGEMHIQLPEYIMSKKFVDLTYKFTNNESIIKLMMVIDTLHRNNIKIRNFYIQYIPFSREDRMFENGGSFGLAFFANIVNSANARVVSAIDVHSPACIDLIKNLHVIQQHEVFVEKFRNKTGFVLVAPDKGSLPKIEKLAFCVDEFGVLTFDKERELSTGKILRHYPKDWRDDYLGKDFYIVDDICDGGATYVSIGKQLKILSPNSKVVLMVTHGFFTKGLDVFNDIIDEVYTKEGKIK